jgi:hypothetical protein
MIIDDSVSFFGVYYHNCVFNLGLSESFKDLYEKQKYLNVILCQKDAKGGFLLTQNISERNGKSPYMQSYYFNNKKELKEGFNLLSNRINSCDKIFYLIRIDNKYDFSETEKLVRQWKNEVKSNIS